MNWVVRTRWPLGRALGAEGWERLGGVSIRDREDRILPDLAG